MAAHLTPRPPARRRPGEPVPASHHRCRWVTAAGLVEVDVIITTPRRWVRFAAAHPGGWCVIRAAPRVVVAVQAPMS